MTVIVAWITYFVLGLITTRYLFPHITQRNKLFVMSYLVASLFMFLFHFYAVYGLKISFSPTAIGTFSPDGAFYHEAAIKRSTNLTNPWIIDYARWTIAWQYVVAINYWIFGINSLYPKIFNVFIFSIAAIAFTNISFFVSRNKRTAKRSYRMFIFFIPLLYFNGRVLRETFMTFLIIMIVYCFAMFKEEGKSKWVYLLICASLVLFLTRAEFLLIVGGVIAVSYIMVLDIKISRKIAYGTMCLLIFSVFSSLSFVKDTQIMDTITGDGDGRTRSVKSSNDDTTVVSGGYFELVKVVVSSPLSYAKAMVSGTIGFFLSPLPNKFLKKSNYKRFGNYFFSSLYNVYFYFLLPAIFFGIYYKCIFKSFDFLDFIIIFTLLLTLTAISLHMRDPLRYRTPVFPFLLLYASHGIGLFKLWEKYLGLMIMLMCAGMLFFTLFFDVKSLIS